MIVRTWIVLVALTIVSWWVARLDAALLAALGKTMLLGRQFMELQHAARGHAMAWSAWACALASLLLLLHG